MPTPIISPSRANGMMGLSLNQGSLPPLLVVVTLLSGGGPTGVETHFNVLSNAAKAHGIATLTITPYTVGRWQRAPYRALKHGRSELARVLYRWGQARLLRAQLKRILQSSSGREITFYAQCPLSAWACLSARGDAPVSTVLVIHYNGSEAEEIVATGSAKPGGRLVRHFENLEKTILPRVDRLAFVSNYMQRVVNCRWPGLSAANQRTIVNFPSVARPAAGERLLAGDLLAIGTLEPRKNQEFLLRVLRATRDQGFRYRLTIIGSGPDRVRLERLVVEYGLSDQVSFLGFQPSAGRYLSTHRVLVHAAKLENCPLIVAEALSFGRPVFAAPVGGIPELFSDAVEGFYWSLDEPEVAAEKLAALLENPSRYAATADAARRRYERDFTGVPQRWLKLLFPTAEFASDITALTPADSGVLSAAP